MKMADSSRTLLIQAAACLRQAAAIPEAKARPKARPSLPSEPPPRGFLERLELLERKRVELLARERERSKPKAKPKKQASFLIGGRVRPTPPSEAPPRALLERLKRESVEREREEQHAPR